jgi:hypothetical protein
MSTSKGPNLLLVKGQAVRLGVFDLRPVGVDSGLELKLSQTRRGRLIFRQLPGCHRSARRDQCPVGSNAPRLHFRQLLRRLVAEREARMQGWNRVVSDATASNNGPLPIRTIVALAS